MGWLTSNGCLLNVYIGLLDVLWTVNGRPMDVPNETQLAHPNRTIADVHFKPSRDIIYGTYRRPSGPYQTSIRRPLDVIFDGFGIWTSFGPPSDVRWTPTRRHIRRIWCLDVLQTSIRLCWTPTWRHIRRNLLNSQCPISSNFWLELFVYDLSWWWTNQWNFLFN